MDIFEGIFLAVASLGSLALSASVALLTLYGVIPVGLGVFLVIAAGGGTFSLALHAWEKFQS